jgi:hypothetical protein
MEEILGELRPTLVIDEVSKRAHQPLRCIDSTKISQHSFLNSDHRKCCTLDTYVFFVMVEVGPQWDN